MVIVKLSFNRSYCIIFAIYPMDFKIWVFGGFKATKFADRSRPNIDNIKSAPIGE